jgi:hypothetical protein
MSHIEMLFPTNAFIYFKEYEEDKHLLTYPSKKMVETVGSSIFLVGFKMAKVAHMGSVEKMTVVIKEQLILDGLGRLVVGCTAEK